jgi:hypothetical protein
MTELFHLRCILQGVCEPECFVKDMMQLMLVITMPTVIYNENEIFQQQGLGYGDQHYKYNLSQLSLCTWDLLAK